MSYNAKDYNRVREEYSTKWADAQNAADGRMSFAELNIPGISEINKKLRKTGPEIMAAALSCTAEEAERKINELKEENQKLLNERAELLVKAGYPADYLAVKYECQLCEDSGYVGTKMCVCMKRRLTEVGLESSGMSSLLMTQTFDTFSLDYYKSSTEAYDRMTSILKIAKNYANDFDTFKSPNLALFGDTGLGKTHISSAIAVEVINKGFDVYYASSLKMLADFEKQRFGSSIDPNADKDDTERYFACDLLIIDDLGAEVINQFTTSCLYNVINSRINSHRPVIINTNLSGEEFRKKYWDRITSRVFGLYTVLPFLGTDIRRKNRMADVNNRR